MELFSLIFRETGMIGVVARLQDCWNERRAPGLTRAQVRWSYEACAAMDLAASGLHAAAMRELPSLPMVDYLRSSEQDARLAVFRSFATEGLMPTTHRRALSRSVDAWLEITAFGERPRSFAPGLPGARGGSGGPTSAPYLADAPTQPVYPDAARRNGEAGEVGLALRIGEDGRVLVVDVERSSGFGVLDDAARLAALRWRFQPAQRDGTKVPGLVRATASFGVAQGGGPRVWMRTTGG